ncbi:hypothetical protein V7S43_011514 [Phytophthora oleae]|uniref:Uncharacterized protein n=1 Tax=Phytophthora oleae TaxID=2107226 RepID=A0ABD3FA74_9STRA
MQPTSDQEKAPAAVASNTRPARNNKKKTAAPSAKKKATMSAKKRQAKPPAATSRRAKHQLSGTNVLVLLRVIQNPVLRIHRKLFRTLLNNLQRNARIKLNRITPKKAKIRWHKTSGRC